jgi:hypothetical protein
MRRLLMRVFSAGFGRRSTLGQSWAVEGAQEQVDRDTPVSRTPKNSVKQHVLLLYEYMKKDQDARRLDLPKGWILILL